MNSSKRSFRSKVKTIIEGRYLLIIFAMSLFYNFYYHKTNSWDVSIWSDQEGYYVYLPGTFIYDGFKDVPVKSCCGSGEDGKLVTKYTSGVAMMELPFFLIIHGIVSLTDIETTGLDGPYALVIMFSAVFYLTLGSWLLRKFLLRYYSPLIASLTVLLIFLGTNLFFYSVRQSGMSHVYSYFLFAAFFVVLCELLDTPKTKWFLLMGIIYGMICLTRPTNAVLGLFLVFFETRSLSDVKDRILFYLKNWGNVIMALLCCVVVAVPQMLYWKYIYDSYITYSYKGSKSHEGFPNWNKPQLLNALFSHQNGWFIYTPLAFFPFIASFWMAIKRELNGRLILVVLLVILYVLSSWHMWWFGGSFGYRSMVEYYAILAIPLAWLLQKVQQSDSKKLKNWTIFLCIFFVVTNIRMVEWYHAPWNGDDWTWREYLHVWLRAYGLADIVPH